VGLRLASPAASIGWALLQIDALKDYRCGS
jgi:hypothetical protein